MIGKLPRSASIYGEHGVEIRNACWNMNQSCAARLCQGHAHLSHRAGFMRREEAIDTIGLAGPLDGHSERLLKRAAVPMS